MAFVTAIAILAFQTTSALPTNTIAKVVQGEAASQGSSPYIVSLQREGHHHCGGSLISATRVLTAAHCGKGSDPTGFTVHAGSIVSLLC